jgi:hypothetical protein
VAETFGTVVIVVAVLGAVVAAFAFARSGAVYDELGKGDLALDEPELRKGPQPGSAAWRAEADMELRQLLEAKAARAEARGEVPIDVEAELARLSAPPPSIDPGLRAEVRDLVIASNERRLRRGLEPIDDVEAEVERRLRDLGAGDGA